jgi:hypothetical protein
METKTCNLEMGRWYTEHYYYDYYYWIDNLGNKHYIYYKKLILI